MRHFHLLERAARLGFRMYHYTYNTDTEMDCIHLLYPTDDDIEDVLDSVEINGYSKSVKAIMVHNKHNTFPVRG